MGRIALGAMLGGVPAILIGTVMGISPIIRQLFQPLAAALYAVPKIALLPLVIVILGLGEASKVFTLAISIFFLIVLNVMASVLQVDRQYFDVAKTFGANAQAMFWGIALPGSMPGILTSLKLGMGFAFTLIVGIEFVGASSGIGWMVWHAYELYVIDRMLASLVVIAVMGWVVTALLDYAEARLVPWQRA
jgi:NitT/TauT family transport system permease protein